MSDEADENAGADVPAPPTGGVWPPAPGEQPEVTPPSPPPSGAPPGEPADAGWTTPPAGAGKKRSHAGLVIGLVVGGLVVVVGAILGAVLLLSSSESFPDDDQDALIRAIPGQPAASACDPISVDRADAAVSCRVAGGSIVVTAAQFAGVDGANDGFEAEEEVVELSDSSTSDCIDRNEVEHDYETVDGTPGRALCYRKAGRSVIAWTDPEAGRVFRATRSDADDVALYEWWAEGIRRRFPTVEQLDALKALAPEGFEDCEWWNERAAATVAITCTNADGARLYYNQFEDVQDLADEYVSSLGDTDLEQGENVETGTCPFEGAATTLGEQTGRVFCAYDDDDVPRVVYTDEPSRLLIEVYGDENGDGDALVARVAARDLRPARLIRAERRLGPAGTNRIAGRESPRSPGGSPVQTMNVRSVSWATWTPGGTDDHVEDDDPADLFRPDLVPVATLRRRPPSRG